MASAATSRTDPYASSVITHKIQNKKDGTWMLVKHALGSGGTYAIITLTGIVPGIHATDEYEPVLIEADGITLDFQTYKIDTSGNYMIPIVVPDCVKTIKASVAFTGGSAQVMVVDFQDE
jgi:hypothetical protein